MPVYLIVEYASTSASPDVGSFAKKLLVGSKLITIGGEREDSGTNCCDINPMF